MKLEDMIIYLLDINAKMTDEWDSLFIDFKNVNVVNKDFETFMMNSKVECVVSPANSFGLMDGGYDLAITNWFGSQLQKRVQRYIIDNFYGEQPVGSSFIINASNENINGSYLIHTPSMRYPQVIIDNKIVYYCMRSTLIEALNHNIKSIVISAFGGSCGKIEVGIIANMMFKAYTQILNPPKELNWKYVNRNRFE